MTSQPEHPDTAHAESTDAQLVDELHEKCLRLRDQLEAVRDAVSPIAVGVDLLRRDTDLLDPPAAAQHAADHLRTLLSADEDHPLHEHIVMLKEDLRYVVAVLGGDDR